MSPADRRIRRAACRVLADAFADDPWACHVLGVSARQRPAALAAVMRVPVGVSARRGGLVVQIDTAGAPAAVSTWVPGDRRAVGPVDVVAAGASTLPVTAGLPTLRRLASDEAALDRVLLRTTLRPGDAYLWLLGVARDRHGRGLGRTVVDRTCRQAAARGFSRLVLNTDNPANIAIYERLGFALVARERRPSGLTAHILARGLTPELHPPIPARPAEPPNNPGAH